MTEAATPNAADKTQVKHAGRKEKDRSRRDAEDLAELLRMPIFRRYLWNLIGFCGHGENPTRARGDETHQNIGKQDVARKIISDIGICGGMEPWLQMQREAWAEKRREELEAESVRIDSAKKKDS